MALETPNVAHAAGVAVALISDPDPFNFVGSLQLASGQGFSDVGYGVVAGGTEATAQRWTLTNDIAAQEAVVHAGGTFSPLGLCIVGIPDPIPGGLPPELFESSSVLTEMNPVLELDSPAQLWCVVYAVPRNGEA